ncbi:MAG TPA: DUF349 domain-containing protein [Bacteroidales bacterium]|nr:DUF349 domain-containing protein [Bacteroidales bacterium]HRZ48410.1 DUF349 domain-containing protein [Bacteroidales bacterium]
MTDVNPPRSPESQEQILKAKEQLCREAERLQNSTEWRETAEKLKELQQEWKRTGSVFPRELADELYNRFRKACDAFFENRTRAFQNQELERIDNLYRKTELCELAEALQNLEDPDEAAEEMQKLFAEWKQIGPVPREKSEALWERFRSAQDMAFQRRKLKYEEKDREREENLRLKEALCIEAESLAEREDYTEVTPLMINLQERWKNIGPVPREKTEELWERFRKSCDHFFERKTDHNNRLDEQRLANLIIRQNLCKMAESLKESVEWNDTSEKIKQLQQEWKAAWPVPKDEGDRLWESFREACDHFFERKRIHFEEKRIEWQKNQAVWRMNMEKAIARKTEEISRLEAAMEYERNHFTEWQLRLEKLPAELKSVDMKLEIEEKLARSQAELERKQAMIRQLEADIADIHSKLGRS